MTNTIARISIGGYYMAVKMIRDCSWSIYQALNRIPKANVNGTSIRASLNVLHSMTYMVLQYDLYEDVVIGTRLADSKAGLDEALREFCSSQGYDYGSPIAEWYVDNRVDIINIDEDNR